MRRRAGRYVVAAAALVFVVRVLLGIHGFSLPAWHEVIDGSPPGEVLLGHAQGIRSDDWMVILPMALSQRAHRPAFPVVNRLIGAGQNMIAGYPLPVLHPVTFFRPQMWGYFLGDDTGLAWHWATNSIGLFLSWFWLFLILSRERTGLAALGALVLLYSPFLQFWSLNSAPLLTATALGFSAAARLAFAETFVASLAFTALLAWSGLVFIFYLYPPYQVALAYLWLALTVGYVGRELGLGKGVTRRRLKTVLLAGAAVLSAGVIRLWWHDARDAMHLILETDYPGKRVAEGGGYEAVSLFRHDLLLPLWIRDWRPLGNVCEAASAVFLFPVVAAGVLLAWVRQRERPDAVGVALFALVAAIVFWMTGPPHPSFARWTLLWLTPSTRALVALVPADVALAVWFLASGHRAGTDRVGKVVNGVVLAAWAFFLVWVGRALIVQLGAGRRLAVGLAVALVGATSGLLMARSPRGLVCLAALAIATTFGFNPVVRGGSTFLRRNPLSRRIVEIDAQRGGATLWAVWNNRALANLPRILGVRGLGGVQVYPPLAVWKTLDPDGQSQPAWNRYAAVEFRSSPDLSAIRITSSQPDLTSVAIHAASPALRALGMTHVIIDSDVEPDRALVGNLRLIDRVGHYFVYEVPR